MRTADARLLLLILPALAGAAAAADRSGLADVMRRVHTYVNVYEDHQLSTVVAHERYHQRWLAAGGALRGERTLRSDFVLLQLPDEDWVALRDVYEVDGATISEREARLTALFAGPRDELGARAAGLVEAAAAFNIGALYFRTVNLPTFALRVLRPASRKRISFGKVGEEQVDGTRAWVIAFRETKGPTFSATPKGQDIPAHGRFWVDPGTGAVLRSEMILGGTRRMPARAAIVVTYALDPALGFRVPVAMHERYDNPRRDSDDIVLASAEYSEFRRVDWRTRAAAAQAPVR